MQHISLIMRKKVDMQNGIDMLYNAILMSIFFCCYEGTS